MGLTGKDGIGAMSVARLETYRERDLQESCASWGTLTRLQRLHEVRRQVDDGIVSPRQVAEGRNKVLLQGVTRILQAFKDGTQYQFTHLDFGTSNVATDESQTGPVAHVDAASGVPRVSITEQLIDGKVLRTSTFIGSNEYNGSTLREASLCDAPSGGTPYNRVLFASPIAKVDTDTAVANIDHEIVN